MKNIAINRAFSYGRENVKSNQVKEAKQIE